MDCPLCRQAVLWVTSRDLAAPPGDHRWPVYQRSATIAAQWVPIREASFTDLAGYIASHPAGQQYQGYWTQSVIRQADKQVTRP